MTDFHKCKTPGCNLNKLGIAKHCSGHLSQESKAMAESAFGKSSALVRTRKKARAKPLGLDAVVGGVGSALFLSYMFDKGQGLAMAEKSLPPVSEVKELQNAYKEAETAAANAMLAEVKKRELAEMADRLEIKETPAEPQALIEFKADPPALELRNVTVNGVDMAATQTQILTALTELNVQMQKAQALVMEQQQALASMVQQMDRLELQRPSDGRQPRCAQQIIANTERFAGGETRNISISSGDADYFNAEWFSMKAVDPSDPSSSPRFVVEGVSIAGVSQITGLSGINGVLSDILTDGIAVDWSAFGHHGQEISIRVRNMNSIPIHVHTTIKGQPKTGADYQDERCRNQPRRFGATGVPY